MTKTLTLDSPVKKNAKTCEVLNGDMFICVQNLDEGQQNVSLP